MKLLSCLFIFIPISTGLPADSQIEEPIVKIYTVAKIPNYSTPWNSSTERSNASGVIIEGTKILTNVRIVVNQTFIEVKRYGDPKRYEAKVAYISHQADLALLIVNT